jgi:hypothetical protein
VTRIFFFSADIDDLLEPGRRQASLARLVRAAFRAARRNPARPFVWIAFLAALRRLAAPRFLALARACRPSASVEAPARPSLRSFAKLALERLADGFRLTGRARPPRDDFDSPGAGGSFTPAFRALDRPIAIACLADLTPCFPSLTWWISSRTNSPACVDGDRPWRAFFLARSTTCFSGMFTPPVLDALLP